MPAVPAVHAAAGGAASLLPRAQPPQTEVGSQMKHKAPPRSNVERQRRYRAKRAKQGEKSIRSASCKPNGAELNKLNS